MSAKTLTELDYALNCAAVEIDTTNARAELAQLRADLQAARSQLDQARSIIVGPYEGHGLTSCACNFCRDRRAWLAANALQPVSAFAAIDKLMSEHPDLFKDDQQPQEQSA